MLWHLTLQFTVSVSGQPAPTWMHWIPTQQAPNAPAPDFFSIHSGCAVSVYSQHPHGHRPKYTCGACDKYQPMSATSLSRTHPSLCLVGTLPGSQSLD